MECVDCRKPDAALVCELCEEAVCRKCVEVLPSDAFFYRSDLPENLKHSRYCGACYDLEVAGELDAYLETLEQAKRAFVFFKTQRKSIPLLSKERLAFKIESCPDRDETILRLAFIAASHKMNAVIDVEVHARKLRNEAYQTSVWSGTGVPALVDESKVYEQDLREEIYR